MTAARPIASYMTIAAALDLARRRLSEAGIEDPRREARSLIGHALHAGVEITLGHPERELSPDELDRIAALVAARAQRRPMAQVTGRREFWSLEFEVTCDTLDPRADSECLIEAALAVVPDRDAPLRILDLGTGTGCLLLALLHECPRATGLGVDISQAALAVAKRNARALGLAARAAFLASDWGRAVAGEFDLVLANPPYIRAADLAALAPEVAHFEPRLALDGGPDGLDAYRRLAPDVARTLAPGGFAVIEVGDIEGARAIFAEAGLVQMAVGLDLAGRERALVLSGHRPKSLDSAKKGRPKSLDLAKKGRPKSLDLAKKGLE
jgi:release factor glutamine methyltransferase